MIAHFQQLFTYDDWANREAAASVERAASAPEKAHKVLAHIIGTQWLWLARIRGTKAKMAIWPELSPAECIAESQVLLAAWRELLASLGEAVLNQPATYKNSKGEPWTSTVSEILTHVALHGAYHRGQIATLLRDSGNEPAYTDYIHAVRSGLL
ncbi:MAG: DinB family protein [Acidobacteriota bacterium]|nr:DinB family protein [Acidobacteriota bacterium]